MPQTDILNPAPGWDPELGDSMNPSYGFTRKRASTQLHKKAVGGTPWTRETANTGHAFSLSWLGRTLAVAERLKWYQEQYEDGFFTIVDWDGGAGEQGRHYVGRFTSEVVPTETANNRWDVQNVDVRGDPAAADGKVSQRLAEERNLGLAVRRFRRPEDSDAGSVDCGLPRGRATSRQSAERSFHQPWNQIRRLGTA
jgi:hypothetical protein